MSTTAPTFRFMQHNVTNGADKVKVTYSMDNRIDARKCVTLYAEDYGSPLFRLFKGVEDLTVENHSDSMTDYFDKDHATIFEGHPLYTAARERAELNAKKAKERTAVRYFKMADRYIAQRLARHSNPTDPAQVRSTTESVCEQYGLDVAAFNTWKNPAPVEPTPEPVAEPAEVSRFDYPKAFGEFLRMAMAVGTLDAMDVIALGAKHGTNYMAAVNDVIETAYNDRHTNPGRHAALCPLANDCAAPAGTVQGAGGLSTTDTPASMRVVKDPFGMVTRARNC